MRQVDEDAAEVFRVVRIVTYRNGGRRRFCYGPYPTMPSAKGARSVLQRDRPRSWEGAASYDYEIQRATTQWETV